MISIISVGKVVEILAVFLPNRNSLAILFFNYLQCLVSIGIILF